MTFGDIPDGTAIFVDANVFVYYFGPHPTLGDPSRRLLERVQRNEIQAYTSAHILAEVAHRVMTLEAVAVFGGSSTGVTRRLKRHPDDVRQLSRFRQAIQEVSAIGVSTIPLDAAMVDSAAAASQQTGLLTNDALIVAAMQKQALTHLASHDSDFDHVPGLIRYAPA